MRIVQYITVVYLIHFDQEALVNTVLATPNFLTGSTQDNYVDLTIGFSCTFARRTARLNRCKFTISNTVSGPRIE